MSKITSAVGILLIAGAGVVAAVSTSHEDILKANKTLCEKYTKDAELALSNKDFNKALKFAKLAIKVDPENKSGYKILTKISNAQCASSKPATTNTAPTPAKATVPKQPAPAEDEEEMGC